MGRDGQHQAEVKRRRRLWRASCSCGWALDVVSGFEGWTATKRHLDGVHGADVVVTPRKSGSFAVRLLPNREQRKRRVSRDTVTPEDRHRP
ncbi:MAG: hypothetical protein ACYDD4_04120 [Acidimicrobiales bacterium]